MFFVIRHPAQSPASFLAIGHGQLPDLIGFANNPKENKSLAYQSLLDALGEHVSDATKLATYKQLSDSRKPYTGFVDLSQGIEESIAHYLPEAQKYAALRNSANGWLSPAAFEQKYFRDLEGVVI